MAAERKAPAILIGGTVLVVGCIVVAPLLFVVGEAVSAGIS